MSLIRELPSRKRFGMEIMMERVDIVYNQVEEAISVMKEVAQWGREQSFRVWLDEWLTPEELISEDAKPENFCIGKVGGKTACAFILQNRDSEYWKGSSGDKAVYLHKLCVKREYAHRDMTKSVVEAIKEECRKNGIKYIRLDTGLDEKTVRQIYLNAGFKIVGIIDYDNGRSIALYEMEVRNEYQEEFWRALDEPGF